MDIHEACVQYLKAHDTQRILKGLKNKYRSYGAVKGFFVLQMPTQGELQFLKGLFKRDFEGTKSIRISLLKFQEAFAGTVFEGVTLEVLLSSYFKTDIQSKKEEFNQLYTLKQNFMLEILSTVSNRALLEWLEKAYSCSEDRAYKYINELYSDRNDYDLKILVSNLEALLKYCALHEEGLGIPMAAGLATGNPHALDRGMPLRKLFIYFAMTQLGMREPKTLSEIDALFEAFNLRTDEKPRMVLTFGLEAFDLNDAPLGWGCFSERGEPLYVTELNLKKVAYINGKTQDVYCFENPSTFFSAIRLQPDLAAICTSGQINKLVYVVLDYLVDLGHLLHYSGDFDPEGMLIADRLKQRYKGLDISFFNKANYQRSLSSEVISERRLKQFQNLKAPELIEVSKMIVIKKRAGYEELCVEP
ncbi:TIGR02679 domain-containing protein [Fusibacter sp. 3D3]|uniref:TIGR02679 domain-containing protein n=1 Tax=Fusibacter sp. 3D3 TaxID=1048380 RepID=UPI000853B0A3|nr:TIGR02679 domain-containing protein [Fusibacter sp. 3D3]GAU77736.1 hypothetical protein F3D3_2365 [Fusibacter sp. 3D3]